MVAALAQTTAAAEPYGEADHAYGEVKSYLESVQAKNMSHSELERELEARGRELLRKLYQGHLDSRGPGETAGPVQGSDGEERREKRPHERQLETIFGTVEVRRVGYGKEGVQSLESLQEMAGIS